LDAKSAFVAASGMHTEEQRAEAVLSALFSLRETSGLPRLQAVVGALSSGSRATERLRGLVNALNDEGEALRIFWKLLPDFHYAGCNDAFAHDGGIASAAVMVGKNDFDERISWNRQANKYRRDDVEVTTRGAVAPRLIERQDTPGGTTWLHTAKAPLRIGGEIVGLLGLYEVIDEKTAIARQRG
jgi:hypothetical protein